MGKKRKRNKLNPPGDWIRPRAQVEHPGLPGITFNIERGLDGNSWTLRTVPVDGEVAFLQGLEDLGFKWAGTDNDVEAPDLMESFDDFVTQFRHQFMELNASEQDQVITELWDIEMKHR